MTTVPQAATRREAGRLRSMVDYYLAVARMAIASEFQYRTGHYFFLLGMIAEPLHEHDMKRLAHPADVLVATQ